MEDISTRFDKAAQAIRNNEDKARKESNETMLDIYGCFKIASCGKCDTKR